MNEFSKKKHNALKMWKINLRLIQNKAPDLKSLTYSFKAVNMNTRENVMAMTIKGCEQMLHVYKYSPKYDILKP
jgi:hypothetical protein